MRDSTGRGILRQLGHAARALGRIGSGRALSRNALAGRPDTTSHLFILQVASTAEDDYQCEAVTTAAPCHARFFENVREVEGVVQVDGRLDLETGDLTLIEVRGDVVLATLRGQFVRTAGAGELTFTVTDGTIDVDLLEGPLASGGLGCLVDLAVGANDCSN